MYMARRRLHHRFAYFAASFRTVLGVVLIWRGIWYILDWMEGAFFHNDVHITLPLSIIIGFLVLYLPDNNLDEIRKL